MIVYALAISGLCLASAAHADDAALIAKGQAAVAAKLHDPESARFTDARAVTYNGQQVVCGRVNGKNRMGGYDGAKPFLFDPGLSPTGEAIIYGGARITDDVISGMAQIKGFSDVCGQ